MIRTVAPKILRVGRARTVVFCFVSFLMAVSSGVLLAADPARAATFRVNSMGDAADNSSTDGECATEPFRPGFEPTCTLRAAVGEANFNDQGDTIVFDPALGGTITLTLGQLRIEDDIAAADLSIQGPGARKIAVSGNDASRVFLINQDTDVSLSGLTVSTGMAPSESPNGGGIYNAGTLTLTDSTVSGNRAVLGFGNTLGGGGIYNAGMLTLSNSTVSGNVAPFSGGGITNRSTLELTNSTVSGNNTTGSSSALGGGGIYNFGSALKLTNSTVSGNTSDSGGGIVNGGGTASLSNTIVAGNTANTNPDARGTFNSEGNNLIGDITGATGFVAADLLNVDPLLGPLQDNGGHTLTHALLQGSPALNAIPNATNGCGTEITTDQRGVSRPQEGKCEIGSFESPDSIAPTIQNAAPTGKKVSPKANATANFSEAMNETTVEAQGTFTLKKKGSTQVVSATVSYDPDTRKATLDPARNLRSGATYVARVSTGATDLAGNALDQNPTTAGDQPKSWRFKVR